jgi:hypothetical protein
VGDADGSADGDDDGDPLGVAVGNVVGVALGDAVGARVGAAETQAMNHWSGSAGLKRTHSSPPSQSTPMQGSHVSHRTGHAESTPPTAHAVPDALSAAMRLGQNDASTVPLHPGRGAGVGWAVVGADEGCGVVGSAVEGETVGLVVKGVIVGVADGATVGAADGGNVVGDTVGLREGDRVTQSVYQCSGAAGLKSTHSVSAPLHATLTQGLHVSQRTGHEAGTPLMAHAPSDEFNA